MANYIKIDRRILEWEWYKNEHTKNVFIHCLLKANWKEGKFQGKCIPRGSFVTSLGKIADELALTVDEVRTALKHLAKTKEITKQTTNKYTVITVNNYELYQELPKQIPNKSQTIPKPFPTIEEKKEKKEGNNIYQQIADLYNDICVSFPRLTRLSDKRKNAIKARLNMYTVDDFKQLFEMAEQSVFLKGGNDRNWMATFDWLITDSNMAKVLDGNYKNKAGSKKKGKQSFEQRTYDYDDLEMKLIAARDKRMKRKEQHD